jgi:hypothetical protein
MDIHVREGQPNISDTDFLEIGVRTASVAAGCSGSPTFTVIPVATTNNPESMIDGIMIGMNLQNPTEKAEITFAIALLQACFEVIKNHDRKAAKVFQEKIKALQRLMPEENYRILD